MTLNVQDVEKLLQQTNHTPEKFQSKMPRKISREQGGLYVSGHRRRKQAAPQESTGLPSLVSGD
jgi:hypothetical protein